MVGTTHVTCNLDDIYNEGFNAGVVAADNRVNANSANYQAGYRSGQNSPAIQYQNCAVDFSNMSAGATRTVYTSFPHGALGILFTDGSGQKVFCTTSISGNSITFTLSADTTYTCLVFTAVGY